MTSEIEYRFLVTFQEIAELEFYLFAILLTL